MKALCTNVAAALPTAGVRLVAIPDKPLGLSSFTVAYRPLSVPGPITADAPNTVETSDFWPSSLLRVFCPRPTAKSPMRYIAIMPTKRLALLLPVTPPNAYIADAVKPPSWMRYCSVLSVRISMLDGNEAT